jgi:thioredoxin reductase (NADPH)
MHKNILLLAILLALIGSYTVSAETIKSTSPQSEKIYPIAIIGSGAGGTMATNRAVLNSRDVLLFTGAKKEMKRSRGHWVRKVDNIPGLTKYKRTIVDLRNETLSTIAKSPSSRYLKVVNDSVASIKKHNDLFTLKDKSGKTYKARHVILATGMMDEQPLINGKIKPILPYANKQLIAYCLLCDGHKSDGKKTAVIGYSEDAAQSALVLHDRYKPSKLILLTNGIPHTIKADTLASLKAKKINVVEEPIQGILGNKKQKLLSGFTCRSGKTVEADIGFVMLGVRPNNKLALDLGAKLDKQGLVKTDENGESSVANLFIVGDLRSKSMKQIYTAWQHAVDAVQLIDRRLRTEG